MLDFWRRKMTYLEFESITNSISFKLNELFNSKKIVPILIEKSLV